MADESAEITLNDNSKFELVQPFKAESDTTSSQTVEVKPLSQTSSQTLEVKPLNQTSNETLELKPVRLDSRQELAVTDPIRTDQSSTLDVKPVALDVCVRTGQASMPPTHVCQPYRHRIGFTLMGVEVFGLSLSGESQTIVEDRPGGPFVVWGDVTPAPPAVHVPPPHHRPGGHGGGANGHEEPGGGLRVRMAD
jgi:hypothetical protein